MSRALVCSRPMDSDLAYRSAGELTSLIRAGAVSTTDVVAHTLARIDEVGSLLNCFTAVWHEEALAAARAADDAVASGAPLGPLHGVPVAVKDTTPVGGRRTTLGSYTHEHWVPERDAYVVAALRRAGAVIVAQTTAPEFAHSLITDSPLWGPTRNPWDLTRTTGGSSGGSGAAVASGCVPLAEGTDMGGSVRIPAAWCGVVGLKPGLGRIPMDSLPSLFDNISHHGPLARCVDDARLFLAATQGPDDADIMSLTTPLDLSAPIEGAARGLRLGLSIDLGCWAVDPEIEAAVRAAAARPAGQRCRGRGGRRRDDGGRRGRLDGPVGRVHGRLLRPPARRARPSHGRAGRLADRAGRRPERGPREAARHRAHRPVAPRRPGAGRTTTRSCARRWPLRHRRRRSASGTRHRRHRGTTVVTTRPT